MKNSEYLYSNKIYWHLDLSLYSEASDLFSSKKNQRIRVGLERLKTNGYNIYNTPLTKEQLHRFNLGYIEYIKNKDKGRVRDVISMVITEDMDINPHRILYVENSKGEFIGGLIFRYNVEPQVATTAYKYFPLQLDDINLPISLTYIIEYMFFEDALIKGIKLIKHGKDSNPFGVRNHIGLAQFKLSLEALPYQSKKSSKIMSFFPTTITYLELSDMLFCCVDEEGRFSQLLICVSNKENIDNKYKDLLNYPNSIYVYKDNNLILE